VICLQILQEIKTIEWEQWVKQMKTKCMSNFKLKHLSLCVMTALSSQFSYAQDQESTQAEKEAEVARITVTG